MRLLITLFCLVNSINCLAQAGARIDPIIQENELASNFAPGTGGGFYSFLKAFVFLALLTYIIVRMQRKENWTDEVLAIQYWRWAITVIGWGFIVFGLYDGKADWTILVVIPVLIWVFVRLSPPRDEPTKVIKIEEVHFNTQVNNERGTTWKPNNENNVEKNRDTTQTEEYESPDVDPPLLKPIPGEFLYLINGKKHRLIGGKFIPVKED